MGGRSSYRQLKPGEPVPAHEPWRTSDRNLVRLTWRVGTAQYVQTYEHRVKDGVVTEPPAPRYTRAAIEATLAADPDLTLAELATVFGVTKSAMRAAVEKYGLRCRPGVGGPSRPLRRDGDDIIAVYLAHGTVKTAEWAGRGLSAIQRRARRAGVSDQGPAARLKPDDCGACPRCRPPLQRPTLVPGRVDDPDDPHDLIEREAAKYQRRATRRLQEAIRVASTSPPPAPLGLDPHDTAWKQRAACRGLDPAIFYPETPDGRMSVSANDLALPRLICSSCPVRDTCSAAKRLLPKSLQAGQWGGQYTAGGVSSRQTRPEAA